MEDLQDHDEELWAKQPGPTYEFICLRCKTTTIVKFVGTDVLDFCECHGCGGRATLFKKDTGD